MKFQILSCIALALAANESSAFVPTALTSSRPSFAPKSLKMSSAEDEIAKLREAAAKAREEAAKLAKVRPIEKQDPKNPIMVFVANSGSYFISV